MKIISGSTILSETGSAAVAESVWIEGAHRIPVHQHERAQLIHSCDGPIVVELGPTSYLVTPQSALWIPAGIPHAVHAEASVQYVSLFIDNNIANEISTTVQSIRMQPLLQQLTLTAAEFKQSIELGAPEQRIVDVIIDQLRTLEVCKLVLPLPFDKRLESVIAKMINSPSRALTLQVVADQSNMSARTLERVFKKETGMSFKMWQQHLLVIRAIDRLRDGLPVKSVAIEMGYQSTSSFISMFKRIMDITPASFIAGIIQ